MAGTFPPISFASDPVTYIAPTWTEVGDLVFNIASRMQDDGLEFDRIVSLAKGGWPMARFLADFLQIREGSSIGTQLYAGIQETLEELRIYQELHNVAGERILLFDDVSDSGKTMAFVTEYLREKGLAALTTATVFYKPHSVYKPDYFAGSTEAWIVFPYEPVETMVQLAPKWAAAGADRTEVERRFRALGFEGAWISYYQANTDKLTRIAKKASLQQV